MRNIIKKFDLFNKDRSGELVIRKMTKNDVKECLDIKFQYFGHFHGGDKNKHDEYALKKLDLTVSLVAEKDGIIVGGYFLKRTPLPNIPGNFYNMNNVKLNGIEGVSLFIHPKYKDMGIGNKLKYYYKNNREKDIDFIWGMAFHGLNNIHHWLKNRVLFNDMFGVYYTIEMYNDKIENILQKTKFLDFYNKNKISVIDYISSRQESGESIDDIIKDIDIDMNELMVLIDRFL